MQAVPLIWPNIIMLGHLKVTAFACIVVEEQQVSRNTCKQTSHRAHVAADLRLKQLTKAVSLPFGCYHRHSQLSFSIKRPRKLILYHPPEF